MTDNSCGSRGSESGGLSDSSFFSAYSSLSSREASGSGSYSSYSSPEGSGSYSSSDPKSEALDSLFKGSLDSASYSSSGSSFSSCGSISGSSFSSESSTYM